MDRAIDVAFGGENDDCPGSTSWHGFATSIIELAALEGLLAAEKVPRLRAIRTADYPRPAARPKNSMLSGERLRDRFGLALALCVNEQVECITLWR